MARLSLAGVVAFAALGILGTSLTGIAAARGGGKGPTRYTLANGCWGLRSAGSGKFVALSDDSYNVTLDPTGPTAAFYLKPTRLGAYLLYDQDKELMAVGDQGTVVRSPHPGKRAEWAPKRARHGTFEIASTQNGRRLGLSKSGELRLKPPDAALPFFFERAEGCHRYPEARPGATGRPFRGTTAKGTVVGFADMHLHITANHARRRRGHLRRALRPVRDHRGARP